MQSDKIQMWKNTKVTKYKCDKNTKVTKCKCDKIQIKQNAKIPNINNPKYKRNSILGVPKENQCVKGGGLPYGGSRIHFELFAFGILHFVLFIFCSICILSLLYFVTFVFCHFCILSYLYFVFLHLVLFVFCRFCVLSLLHFVFLYFVDFPELCFERVVKCRESYLTSCGWAWPSSAKLELSWVKLVDYWICL